MYCIIMLKINQHVPSELYIFTNHNFTIWSFKYCIRYLVVLSSGSLLYIQLYITVNISGKIKCNISTCSVQTTADPENSRTTIPEVDMRVTTAAQIIETTPPLTTFKEPGPDGLLDFSSYGVVGDMLFLTENVQA